MAVKLLRISNRRQDGHYAAQLLCGEQRLLMRLNPRQAEMLKEQIKLAKNSQQQVTLFVRIRKAEGGLL